MTPRKFTYSDVIANAWAAGDPQLAERFSHAMEKACQEFGPGSEAMKAAWASDPELRAKFGEAVSAGLFKMWADPSARAKQAERTKKTYNDVLRKSRSEDRKRDWGNPDYREKQRALAERKRSDPQFREKVAVAVKASWADPEKRAQRLAKIRARRAAKTGGTS